LSDVKCDDLVANIYEIRKLFASEDRPQACVCSCRAISEFYDKCHESIRPLPGVPHGYVLGVAVIPFEHMPENAGFLFPTRAEASRFIETARRLIANGVERDRALDWAAIAGKARAQWPGP
jgi:hypothetical protein